MAVLVDEIGALAAENIENILSKISGDPWPALVEGGWAGLAADQEADLSLRGLQEVARITGRHAVWTPLVATLLASRWFNLVPEQVAAGATVALQQGSGFAAPYAGPTTLVLDASGAPVGRDRLTSIDAFADVMPVAWMSGAGLQPLMAGHAAELHAVLAATTVGAVDTVLARSVDWSQTRVQFGAPIRSFQAVRHHLANMHIAREQAWTAAIAAANEPDHAAAWSAMAVHLATTAIELGIQVHGGVGFTSEVGLQLYLCHVLQIRDVLGALP